MNIRYTRSMNRNYVHFCPDTAPDPDSYEMKMVLSGQVNSILPCSYARIDGVPALTFDISSRKSLRTLAEAGLLPDSQIREILLVILRELMSLTSCLIEPSRIPLHPDHIYLTEDPLTVRFCFLPGNAGNPWKSLADVMEFFLGRLDPLHSEQVLLCYRLYRAVKDTDLPPEELLHLLLDDAGEESPAAEGTWAFPTYEPCREEDAGDPYQPLPQPLPLPNGSAKKQLVRTKKETARIARRVLLLLVFVLTLPLCYAAFMLYPGSEGIRAVFFASVFFFVLLLLLEIVSLIRAKKASAPSRPSSPQEAHFPPGNAALQGTNGALWSGSAKEGPFPSGHAALQSTNPALRNGTAKPADLSSETAASQAPAFPRRNGTTLLGVSDSGGAALLPSSPGFSTIRIPDHPVLIGSQPGGGNIVLPHDTVSRVHARLSLLGEDVFVEDLNSTNGTYIDGKAIPAREKKKLQNGSRIRFAEVEFTFRNR